MTPEQWEKWATARREVQPACIAELRHLCEPLKTDYFCLSCYDTDMELQKQQKEKDVKT